MHFQNHCFGFQFKLRNDTFVYVMNTAHVAWILITTDLKYKIIATKSC